MKIIFVFWVVVGTLIPLKLRGQVDGVGAGHCLQFDGVNDFVDLGNIYDDLTFPFTISAWIKIPGNITDWVPIFVSQDNAPIYNGFWFVVSSTRLSIGYGDGKGENLPNFRRSKIATISNIGDRWVQVTGIVRGATDMDLYVNGINVGGSYSGTTNFPMSATSTDVAKIGYWFSNGSVYRFKGSMDEVRIWNRSLNVNEIRNSMCKKLIGDETDLIGYWNFNELEGIELFDQSSNHFNGTLQNAPKRIYSGAPIGDNSAYVYGVNSLSGLEMGVDNQYKTGFIGKSGSLEGVQLYQVMEDPSQKGDLPTACLTQSYVGVFPISSGQGSFTINIQHMNYSSPYSVYTRADNSIADWQMQTPETFTSEFKLDNYTDRLELISATTLDIQLPADTIFCEYGVLKPKILGVYSNLEWNTGSTDSEITVTTTGTYSVTVTGACGNIQREVAVVVDQPPPDFDFGDDLEYCRQPIVLRPYSFHTPYSFKWQDDSVGDSLDVSEPGTYWATVSNGCGEKSDTIGIIQKDLSGLSIPNIVTPNGDPFNQYFELDERLDQPYFALFNRWGRKVFESFHYANDFSGSNLASGIYYYTISSTCVGDLKGTLNIR